MIEFQQEKALDLNKLAETPSNEFNKQLKLTLRYLMTRPAKGQAGFLLYLAFFADSEGSPLGGIERTSKGLKGLSLESLKTTTENLPFLWEEAERVVQSLSFPDFEIEGLYSIRIGVRSPKISSNILELMITYDESFILGTLYKESLSRDLETHSDLGNYARMSKKLINFWRMSEEIPNTHSELHSKWGTVCHIRLEFSGFHEKKERNLELISIKNANGIFGRIFPVKTKKET